MILFISGFHFYFYGDDRLPGEWNDCLTVEKLPE